jgi:hypothetical protein
VWDALLVGTIGRVPFLELLCSSYAIPLTTVAQLYLVDITSLVITRDFISSSAPPKTPFDDTELSWYTSLLSATFLTLPLYFLFSKCLPSTLVSHFDSVASVEVLPLPILVFINLPAGYALQTLLTRYRLKGVLAALSNVVITGTGLMYFGLVGADIYGVEMVNAMWLLGIIVSSAATYFIVVYN